MEFRRSCSRTTGAGDITRGSVPGNTTGWITAASTAGTFASRSDSCGYTCRHCNRSDSAHLAAIATGPVLSGLRGLRLYTKEILPDIAHETYGADPTVEYAYAATIIQSCSAGGNAEITPNTFKEAMTLPAKAQ